MLYRGGVRCVRVCTYLPVCVCLCVSEYVFVVCVYDKKKKFTAACPSLFSAGLGRLWGQAGVKCVCVCSV